MRQDLRHAAQMLLKNPGFTVVAILTLALGIGVSTATFTVYDAFVLKPLPLKDANSIATVTGYDREGKHNRLFSYLDYVDYRDRNQSFAGLIAWNNFSVPFGEDTTDMSNWSPLPANSGIGSLVSANYFTVLGAEMALGRGFLPEEDQAPGTHPVLVLSHSCWERRFHSDPNIVGKAVRVAGLPFTIIGVTAPGFIGLTADSPHFWVPLMMRDQLIARWNHGVWLTERRASSFAVTGRLKPGVSPEQAQAEFNLINEQLSGAYPDQERKTSSIIVRSSGTFIQLDDDTKPLVAPILTAVGLVFLIACINVTNMLLAHSVGRQREIAVRLAVGASRLRLVRQLLTESVLLGGIAGALGLLTAIWAIHLIYPLVLAQLPVPPMMLEQFALDLAPDYRIFAFALFISLLAGTAAGLVPALQSSRPNLVGALKDGGSAFGGQLSRSRFRNGLVVVQIAVCLTLLIAAGLLTRNLQKLKALEPGLVTKNVFTVSVSAQGIGQEPNKVNEFYRQLAERLRTLPGVKNVAQAERQPLSGRHNTVPITIAGKETLANRPFEANYNFVSANYFETLGLRITRGRSFTAQEEQSSARVVLISESTARRFWPNEDPIGKYVGLGLNAPQIVTGTTPDFPRYEIIGLTNDTRQGQIWRPDETFFYLPLPLTQTNVRSKADYLIVRTEGDARAVMKSAHNEAAALEPNVFVLLSLLDDLLEIQTVPFQDVAVLAGTLSLLALLLALIGLYGVMSFVVSQRTREIGIRVALGAQRRDVIALFLRQGAKLIAPGVALGLAGGAAVSGLLGGVLTDISRFDPLAFCVVAAFLIVIELSACYVPARRATKVDPLIALRYE